MLILKTWTGNCLVGETGIINASPLIFLGMAGHLALLRNIFAHCLVPEPVRTEILHPGENDRTAQALVLNPWLGSIPAPQVPDTITAWGLGPGESSVLASVLVHTERPVVAVLDDLAGRKCAASLGIPVRGTLGIVLVAKKRGLIPLARPVMADLIASGLYLSKDVLNQALARVGE